MSSQRSIALQLRKLASDTASQTFICQEPSCLSGLLSLLNSPDSTDTLVIALQALLFLSSHPQCKETLARQPGLIVRLTVLTEHDDEKVRTVVAQVLAELQAMVNRERTESTRRGPGLRRVAKYLHSIMLQVRRADCVDDGRSLSVEERSRMEKALIVLQGVISVSVSKAGQLTLYTKRDDDRALIDAVAIAVHNLDHALTVQHTITNTSAAAAAASPHNKENIPAVSTTSHTGGSRALVAASSLEQTSLQSRFQAKQRKAVEADNKQGMVRGLFSTVSSFFW